MLSRYKDVVQVFQKYRNHKDRAIRKAIISLLPRVAKFIPKFFSTEFFPEATIHLLGVLKVKEDRPYGFQVLGDFAAALSSNHFAHVLQVGFFGYGLGSGTGFLRVWDRVWVGLRVERVGQGLGV